jgi:hypothetical protein
VLSGRFTEHLAACGIQATPPEPGVYLGSSDIGDVRVRVPAIHPFVAIAAEELSDHTPEFAEAAASPRGRAAMPASASALARTAIDPPDAPVAGQPSLGLLPRPGQERTLSARHRYRAAVIAAKACASRRRRTLAVRPAGRG